MAVLPSSTRYFNAGTSKYYFLPAVADADLEPTRAEITAGTDITGEIADVSGWTAQAGEIEVPDMGSDFTDKIPGKLSTDDSSITFYGDVAGDDIRAVLPRGTAGFLVIADGGDVTGQPADVFPVRVRSVGKLRSVGEDSFRITVQFSITGKPAEDVALPATA